MYPNSENRMKGIFVHEQVKSLIKLGAEIKVISPVPITPQFLSYFNKKWKSFRKIPYKEILDGVEIYHIKFLAIPRGYLRNYWGYFLFSQINSFLKRNNFKFDLIHVHGSAPEDFAGYLLSKKNKIPFIITVHGDSVYKLVKHKNRFKNSKRSIENANAVIGVSRNVIERIKNTTSKKENLYLVLNGFTPQENLDLLYKKDKEIIILFVGNLIEQKGCSILIKSLSKIYNLQPHLKVEIIGDGPELKKIKNLVKSLGLVNVVSFFGQILHDDVMKHMLKCNIFVMPSWDEAFGVVYLEAMSFRKPIIATKNEGISDLIVDGKNGFLVKSRDVDDLADKLYKLISNPGLRESIGNEGFKTIKNLTWENSAKQVYEIYKETTKNVGLLNEGKTNFNASPEPFSS
jgi:glycosyltransferase involved in cell wall biosynthesis